MIGHLRVESGSIAATGCAAYIGCFLAVIAFNLTIGGLLFQYCLWSILGRDIPWYGDAVAGLFLGEFALPAAVICWVMRLCGVPVPFMH